MTEKPYTVRSRWSRRPTVLVGLALLGMAAVAIRSFWPRPTLESEAKRLMDCLESGDSRCLLAASWDEEAKSGLDDRSADLVMKNIIAPFWRGRKRIGTVQSESLGNEGIAGQNYELRNGEPFKRVLVVFSDGKRARVLFFEQLQMTFMAMSAEQHSRSELGGAVSVVSGIEGIDRYADELRRYGVTGVASYVQGDGAATVANTPFHTARANLVRVLKQTNTMWNPPKAKE